MQPFLTCWAPGRRLLCWRPVTATGYAYVQPQNWLSLPLFGTTICTGAHKLVFNFVRLNSCLWFLSVSSISPLDKDASQKWISPVKFSFSTRCDNNCGSAFSSLRVDVCTSYINTQRCISQTKQNFIMFIIVLGQHVSILIQSSSGPSKTQNLT